MIRAFDASLGRLKPIAIEAGGAERDEALRRATWVDLREPGEEEDATVNRVIGVDIPSRAEMEEIETSSRLYTDDQAAFMTAMIPAGMDMEQPHILPVSFILARNQLVTVRYHDPKAFKTYVERAAKMNVGCVDAFSVLAGLLDAVIDRVADTLEMVGRDVDAISRSIFPRASTTYVKGRDFQGVLHAIGRKADLLSIIRDSLATFDRMFSFLANVAAQGKIDKDTRARIKTLARDTASLIDHASFLSQKITFLLDATLGLISIEQNAIIKIFSVAAVIFLPPTLVASVYGMNFQHMPELGWTFGYPVALGLMALSAIVPYLFFKRRGWL